ncbi:MAG: hypothetical protein CMF25_06670 [Kangiellaceae bacterium]|nr:hypothetical protein [Kangiellaceae bacterium]|tara:strand:- start:224 stop:568 length:345 start_codon:yes stop_codon:yes gene_type:complete
MNEKVEFVERVFDFVFEGGFQERFESLGFPEDDLQIWFLNARTFSKLIINQELTEDDKFNLLTLIEAARFEVECSASDHDAEPAFDFSGYQLSETFVASWRDKVINLISGNALF